MARAARKSSSKSTDIIPESDCREGALHPRLNRQLFGHGNAENSVLEAIKSSRMHHAWLIQGPNGIGKATFAYRIARFLLASGDLSKASSLDVDGDHLAVRQIAAHSHPDMYVLRREWVKERKRLRQSIAVDDVRKLISFFHHTSGAGGWRVAIVDAMDDLNKNGANALLKILEEPPERALFLLVSSSPGALPATIKSRCRRLSLSPLNDDDMMSALSVGASDNQFDKLDNEARSTLLSMAGGSPGQAIELLSGNGLAINRDIEGILQGIPDLDYLRLHKLAASVAKAGAEKDFQLSLSLLKDWIAARVKANVADGHSQSFVSLAKVWGNIDQIAKSTDVLNLDRRRAMLNAFNLVAAHYPR